MPHSTWTRETGPEPAGSAAQAFCRREIGCQRSLMLELLRTALLMKSDAINACGLYVDMLQAGSERHGSVVVTVRVWRQVR